MDDSHAPHDPHDVPAEAAYTLPAGHVKKPLPRWLAERPWLVYLLPLAVFMVAGSFEPTSPDKPWSLAGFSIEYADYPIVYSVKIALTMLAIGVVWPGYGQFPFRVSPLALVVGAIGVVAWIALTKLGLEAHVWPLLGMSGFGDRSAFDPFERWPDEWVPPWVFVAVRLWGLAVVVPVIEEFFLRGFVMRFVIAADWPRIPIGTLTPVAYAAGTLLPVAMHPAEMLAAAVWFTMVTALVWKTKNIWDGVLAHAVTNLLLGVYVLASGEWGFL